MFNEIQFPVLIYISTVLQLLFTFQHLHSLMKFS